VHLRNEQDFHRITRLCTCSKEAKYHAVPYNRDHSVEGNNVSEGGREREERAKKGGRKDREKATKKEGRKEGRKERKQASKQARK